MTRSFTDSPAVRERVPLLIGLTGASGSGKTRSALRLATGIQRVTGGDIYVIDTESRRALHYADVARFRHIQFTAPFGPLDYLAAVEHAVKRGAVNIVIDSLSHEHEGPGGVLEMHAAEVERMSCGDANKAERVKIGAWAKPKAERRRLINSLLQMPVNFIFCFRAKEKLKVIPGRPPEALGWMPIAGEEFVFEATASLLLYPGCNGKPTLQPREEGERSMVKMPSYFADMFASGKQLDEDTGEAMARWAAGTADVGKVATMRAAIAAATSADDLRIVGDELRAGGVGAADKRALAEEMRQRGAALAAAQEARA